MDLSVRHYGFEPSEAKRLKDGWGSIIGIADEDGYLTVEEGRLRVGSFSVMPARVTILQAGAA